MNKLLQPQTYACLQMNLLCMSTYAVESCQYSIPKNSLHLCAIFHTAQYSTQNLHPLLIVNQTRFRLWVYSHSA